MKKFLSFSVVIVLVLTALLPSFAVSSMPDAPSPDLNTISIWIEDAELDVSETATIDVYVNIDHNEEGFEYLGLFAFYPECLTLVRTRAVSPMTSTDLSPSTEQTQASKALIDACQTLGVDVSEVFTEGTGMKYVHPVIDANREDEDTGDAIDCFAEGRAIRFTFSYDPDLNPTAGDIEISLLADPDSCAHCAEGQWADQPVNTVVYGGTVHVLNQGTPAPFNGVPTVEVTNATINHGDATATFDVNIYNNPGIWSTKMYFIYDSAASFNTYAVGDVFSASEFPVKPNNNADKEVDTLITMNNHKDLKSSLEAQGIDYEGKLATVFMLESSDLDANVEGDGKLFSVTLNTASLPAGTYPICIGYSVYNTIAYDINNVDCPAIISFELAQGTLTVDGNPECEHSYVIASTKDASCTDVGRITHRCSKCGETYTETVPALGHNYGSTVVSPTCTASGYTRHVCTRCGDKYNDTPSPALGHSYSSVRVDPSCVDSGYITYTCSRCSNRYVEELDPLGHDWVEIIATGNCGEAATIHYECARCGETKDEAGGVISHVWEQTERVEPTCTEDGFTTHTCSRCGDTYTDSPVSALGHSYVDVVTPPTSDSPGFTTHTCSRCGNTYVDTYVEYVSENVMKLTVSDATVIHGHEVVVSAYIENNTGFGYLRVTPVFDKNVMTLTDVVNGEVSNDIFNHTERNITWESGEDVHGNGTLVTLHFTVNEDAPAGDYCVQLVVKECCTVDEEDVTLTSENGTITVLDFIWGDANGDDVVDGKDLVRLRKYLDNFDDESGTSTVEIFRGADANGDGEVNGKDLMRLRKYITNYDDESGTSTVVLGSAN